MKRTHRTSFIILGIVLLLSALAIACQSFVPTQTSVSAPLPTPTKMGSTTVVLPVSPELVSGDQLVVDLYERINPSVVNITIYGEDNGQVTALGQGSGFIYDTDGYIITNAHVVHGASQVEVIFSDGLTRQAKVIGEDLHSDLAVVKVELPQGVGPLPLGDMSTLAVGQTVVAIGNPFGYSGTLTRGIISALGRTIPALTVFSIPQAIQTDAAINPGNSGGPLLNLNGQVIGVNAQIETGGTGRSNLGVGFAIPVSIIQRVIPSLIQNGEYIWPWLGVAGSDVSPLLVKAMDLPVERGAYLGQVVDGGPASKAGLQGASQTVTIDGRQIDVGGDVITAIDGQPVSTFDDILVYIAMQTTPGQTVTLTIWRDGGYQDVAVTLEPRPKE